MVEALDDIVAFFAFGGFQVEDLAQIDFVASRHESAKYFYNAIIWRHNELRVRFGCRHAPVHHTYIARWRRYARLRNW